MSSTNSSNWPRVLRAFLAEVVNVIDLFSLCINYNSRQIPETIGNFRHFVLQSSVPTYIFPRSFSFTFIFSSPCSPVNKMTGMPQKSPAVVKETKGEKACSFGNSRLEGALRKERGVHSRVDKHPANPPDWIEALANNHAGRAQLDSVHPALSSNTW